MAPATFCKNGVFCVQFVTRFEAGLLLSGCGDTHIPGSDTLYGAIFVVQHLTGSKPGKDIDFQLLSLFTKPAA